MSRHTFIHRSRLPVAAETAYQWHARPGALERLLPPWENVRVVNRTGPLADDARVELTMRVGPAPITWVAEHRDCRPAEQFRDVQIRGPFAHWNHLHRFEPAEPGACSLEDHIEYTLPAGSLGDALDAVWVHTQLQRMFSYRHATTAADLAAHARFADREPLTVAISGASGLIGSALTAFLSAGGHHVKRIVRRQPRPDTEELFFDAGFNQGDPTTFEGLDAVVHLAAENIAGGRWTAERKRRIRASRVELTRELCQMLAQRERPPKVLVCASAIGIYGDRPGETVDESTSLGHGFLAEVCRDWEAATIPARARGIRVVPIRLAMVLSPRGGALASMLAPFRFGLGGRMGDGNQHWSWISIDDVVGAIHHALMTDSLDAPVNLSSPQPLTNREFVETLARVLRRPAWMPASNTMLRLALGEMAGELLLADACVIPRRLQESGYAFRHATLDTALGHLLGKA